MTRVLTRVLIGSLIVLPLLLSGCAPKPPETFLNEYFTALFLKEDRTTALTLIQLPVGITPAAESLGCFPAEEPWAVASKALMLAGGAGDFSARRRIWMKWKQDRWVSIKRQHTTRSTATIRVRIEGALFTAAGVTPAETIELDYILIRLDDQTWRINKVEISDWKPGQKFSVKGQPGDPSTEKEKEE